MAGAVTPSSACLSFLAVFCVSVVEGEKVGTTLRRLSARGIGGVSHRRRPLPSPAMLPSLGGETPLSRSMAFAKPGLNSRHQGLFCPPWHCQGLPGCVLWRGFVSQALTVLVDHGQRKKAAKACDSLQISRACRMQVQGYRRQQNMGWLCTHTGGVAGACLLCLGLDDVHISSMLRHPPRPALGPHHHAPSS